MGDGCKLRICWLFDSSHSFDRNLKLMILGKKCDEGGYTGFEDDRNSGRAEREIGA